MKKIGQSITEYALLVAVITAAFLGMRVLIQSSVNSNLAVLEGRYHPSTKKQSGCNPHDHCAIDACFPDLCCNSDPCATNPCPGICCSDVCNANACAPAPTAWCDNARSCTKTGDPAFACRVYLSTQGQITEYCGSECATCLTTCAAPFQTAAQVYCEQTGVNKCSSDWRNAHYAEAASYCNLHGYGNCCKKCPGECPGGHLRQPGFRLASISVDSPASSKGNFMMADIIPSCLSACNDAYNSCIWSWFARQNYTSTAEYQNCITAFHNQCSGYFGPCMSCCQAFGSDYNYCLARETCGLGGSQTQNIENCKARCGNTSGGCL